MSSRADEEGDAADDRGDRREVHDDGARVEVAERVEAEHGHRGEERGREGRGHAKIPLLEMRARAATPMIPMRMATIILPPGKWR